MMIGEQLKAIRVAKKLSQGAVEARTGLLRCYISRVENGHTVPSVETLEKLARGLEVPMYQLFYDGDEPPKLPASIMNMQVKESEDWASHGIGLRQFTNIRQALSRVTEENRKLILHVARHLSGRKRS